MSKKLLLISQDASLRDLLEEQFITQDDFLLEAKDPSENARDGTLADVPDILICDIIKDIDQERPNLMQKGLSLHGQPYKGAILFLLPQKFDDEKLDRQNKEANNYDVMIKPFHFHVLLRKIRSLLQSSLQEEVLQLGPFRFDPLAKSLIDKTGQKTRLTEKEVAILKFLYRAGGLAVSRDILLHNIWGYHENVSTHTLETHIYRLRKKLEQNATKTPLLVTEAGGYRLLP